MKPLSRLFGLGLVVALVALAPLGAAQEVADPQQAAAMEGILVLPSGTDPEIRTFDYPHHVYVDRDIVVRGVKDKPAARNELLVWLAGTGGNSRGAREFCKLAISQGYHVINLTYPTDIPATVCKREPDPRSFEDFRLSIIRGGEHPRISVARADSIENRLVQLLRFLAHTRASEGWGKFLDAEGNVKWRMLVPAGHSQGGGHAFLIGMKHEVARVIATGAPKDWSPRIPGPAPWLLAESATPKDRFFTFNHEQDRQGAAPEEQWTNLRAFGLNAFGPRVCVDEVGPPFAHSRTLSTNHPGGALESRVAHSTVIANRNADLFGPVWLYMLTEPVHDR